MKKLLFFIVFLCISSFAISQNRVSIYFDWKLYGQGVNEGVYDKPSFHWKILRETEQNVYGYYQFYMYLYSNSGLTVYDYNKTQQQYNQAQYEKRPTEFYDLRIKVCADEAQTVCVYCGDSFWWLAGWEVGEPIKFEVDYANPFVVLEWKSLRVY